MCIRDSNSAFKRMYDDATNAVWSALKRERQRVRESTNNDDDENNELSALFTNRVLVTDPSLIVLRCF